jgi:hypothetical protein
MLSIIHIKGEMQPSRENKFAINLPNYCPFYMIDKWFFCFEFSSLYVPGGWLGLITGQGHSKVCHRPGEDLEKVDVLPEAELTLCGWIIKGSHWVRSQ